MVTFPAIQDNRTLNLRGENTTEIIIIAAYQYRNFAGGIHPWLALGLLLHKKIRRVSMLDLISEIGRGDGCIKICVCIEIGL